MSQAGLSWLDLLHARFLVPSGSSLCRGWLETAPSMLIQEPRPGEAAFWKYWLAVHHFPGYREAPKDELLPQHWGPSICPFMGQSKS